MNSTTTARVTPTTSTAIQPRRLPYIAPTIAGGIPGVRGQNPETDSAGDQQRQVAALPGQVSGFVSVSFVAPSGAVVAMTEVFMAIVQVPVGFLPRPRKVVDPLGLRRGASGAGAVASP